MSENLSRILSKLAIAHRNAVASAMARIGLHSGQAGVLFVLWESDGSSQAELSRELGVAAPTVNALVGKLESKGLVITKQCPEDGRLKRVYLTGKAAAIRPAAENRLEELDEMLFRNFSDLEQSAALIVLSRIADNLCHTENESSEN